MIPWKMFLEWQHDWLEIDPKAIERRRTFLKQVPFLRQVQFKHALDTVRFGRRALVKDYAYAYAAQLALDSSVATTPHRKRLLDLAETHEEGELPDRQRWFECLSLFDQAIVIAYIEAYDPVETISADINQMITFLKARLFVGGFRRIEAYSYHDPKNGYVVTKENVSIDRTLHRLGLDERVTPFTCRQIAGDGFTYMDHRIKDPFEVFLKVCRQVEEDLLEDPFIIFDRCGLVFAAESFDEMYHFANRLTDALVADGAEVILPLRWNKTDSTMNPTNRSSSPNYKAAKTLIMWRGRAFEFQFVTIADFLNGSLSLTDANHELYKLRQAETYSLPLLWPDTLYGIRWSDPAISDRLRVCKESQLGWRVQRQEVKTSVFDANG